MDKFNDRLDIFEKKMNELEDRLERTIQNQVLRYMSKKNIKEQFICEKV